MAVSALAGAALFVSGFTVACVTLASKKPIVLDAKTFIRDSIFYYIGFSILIIAGFYGEISLPFSIAFLLLYVIFVGIVIKMDKDERKRRKELGLSSPLSDEIDFNRAGLGEEDNSEMSMESQGQVNDHKINASAIMFETEDYRVQSRS